MNTSNEIMNITAKNANHNIFDLMASSGEAPWYPVANKSWIFCRGLRGTSTFPFFIVTSGLGSILAKNCRGCRRRVNADCSCFCQQISTSTGNQSISISIFIILATAAGLGVLRVAVWMQLLCCSCRESVWCVEMWYVMLAVALGGIFFRSRTMNVSDLNLKVLDEI